MRIGVKSRRRRPALQRGDDPPALTITDLDRDGLVLLADTPIGPVEIVPDGGSTWERTLSSVSLRIAVVDDSLRLVFDGVTATVQQLPANDVDPTTFRPYRRAGELFGVAVSSTAAREILHFVPSSDGLRVVPSGIETPRLIQATIR
jgi:hypothetical protein